MIYSEHTAREVRKWRDFGNRTAAAGSRLADRADNDFRPAHTRRKGNAGLTSTITVVAEDRVGRTLKWTVTPGQTRVPSWRCA